MTNPCWCVGPWMDDDDPAAMPETVLDREHEQGTSGCKYAPRADAAELRSIADRTDSRPEWVRRMVPKELSR